MNKAKIALSAVAILAVVGGALAFKAATPQPYFVNDTAGKCLLPKNVAVSIVTTTTLLPTHTTQLSIASFNAPCPTVTVIDID